MNEKDPITVSTRSQRPRNPRVPVEFSLDVEGKNAAGAPFSVKAQAVKISRGGATIILDADVVVGSMVTLLSPFGGRLEAQVNGVWNDQLDGKVRIGVKLLHPDGWFAEWPA
jgi:PilZ domain